jgi:hypothetical protein
MIFNCPEDVCYTNFPCDIDQKAKIVDLVLVQKQYASEVDKTSGETMLDSFNIMAVNGKAQLILNINGEKPLPETTELPGRGLQEIKVGSSSHTINFDDYQGVINIDFYNQIRKTSQNYDLYFLTPGLIWDASSKQITMYGNAVIANDLKAFIMSQGKIKWTANGDPSAIVTDENLIEAFSVPLVYSFDVESFETTTSLLLTTNGTWDATLNKSLPSGSVPDIVYSLSELDPADQLALGLIFDPLTGEYELTPEQIGVYSFVVVASNAFSCITGQLPVTITVTAV